MENNNAIMPEHPDNIFMRVYLNGYYSLSSEINLSNY